MDTWSTLSIPNTAAGILEEWLRCLLERLREVYPDVRGIILFGSAARGEPHRDVDLLVVVGGEMGSQERAEVLKALRRALGPDGAWVDLVVVTERGLRWGLDAHYPFYLDIAADGLVLYDADGITALLEHARAEIAARGIQRTETGGWQFPVPYRRRVELSPFDNVTWARRWLEDGERDLQAAEGLYRMGLYERSVTHSQQAVEKSVKAVLACMGRMERTHYVSAHLEAMLETIPDPGWRERLRNLAQAAADLEPAAVASRYPVEVDEEVLWPAERYGWVEADWALGLARKSLETGRAFIQWWTEEEPSV
ncbi:MAG: HEPN domain-containing protein [Anaerolineae bacterium]|nr:HEPN domain-containing protein [Anaerolineae bacterium]